MESMTSDMPPFHAPAARHASPRRTLGAMAVAVLYVALLLAAPVLLRYGPRPEVTSAVARVAVQPVETPRCATAPEFGRPCAVDDLN